MDLLPIELVWFLMLLGVFAFLYASVGHGGASGYLALMALFSLPVKTMKPSALVLNICVSGIAFFFFQKHKHFNWRLFLPFAVTSIPAAFIGGYLEIDVRLYKQLLGVFLVIATLKLLNLIKVKKALSSHFRKDWIYLILGVLIGLFSGMIGIGGGIILSPIIVLLGLGNLKQAAAVSALFIFVNSIAGMIGLVINGVSMPFDVIYWLPTVIIGGAVGAFYGSSKYNKGALTYLLAFVLSIASIKLFLV